MIGHSVEAIGRLLLECLGVPEDQISRSRAALWGIGVFSVFLLLITLLANLFRD